jgi:hypothetical protein
MNFLNYIFSYFFVIGRATPAGKEFMPPRKSSPGATQKTLKLPNCLGDSLLLKDFMQPWRSEILRQQINLSDSQPHPQCRQSPRSPAVTTVQLAVVTLDDFASPEGQDLRHHAIRRQVSAGTPGSVGRPRFLDLEKAFRPGTSMTVIMGASGSGPEAVSARASSSSAAAVSLIIDGSL